MAFPGIEAPQNQGNLVFGGNTTEEPYSFSSLDKALAEIDKEEKPKLRPKRIIKNH
jgi:hypothetical protein